MAVTTTDADGTDDRELDDRALSEYMTVLWDGDVRARSSPDLFTVTTQSGHEYLVDVRVDACECPDFEYRDRVCKHLRRVQFATGRREIPEWIDPDAVDPQLGDHVKDLEEPDGD